MVPFLSMRVPHYFRTVRHRVLNEMEMRAMMMMNRFIQKMMRARSVRVIMNIMLGRKSRVVEALIGEVNDMKMMIVLMMGV